MEKPKITGRVQGFHGNQFRPNGDEVLTLLVDWTFESGTYKKELTSPIQLYGKAPECLDKVKASVSMGDLVEVPYLPGGFQSKNKEFWNATLQGDTFGLKVLEKAKEIPFGEKAPGDF
jgi:hypothetical protein